MRKKPDKPAKAREDRSKKGAAELEAKRNVRAETQKGRQRQHDVDRMDRGGPQGKKGQIFPAQMRVAQHFIMTPGTRSPTVTLCAWYFFIPPWSTSSEIVDGIGSHWDPDHGTTRLRLLQAPSVAPIVHAHYYPPT